MFELDSDVPVFSRVGSLLSAAVISQRVIYTFHPTQKTWNEAREICEDRMGQLVKLESTSQEEELLYLDSHTYNNSMYESMLAFSSVHACCRLVLPLHVT